MQNVVKQNVDNMSADTDGPGSAGTEPVRLTGMAALRWVLRLVRDPLTAVRRCYDEFGPFVLLADVLPFYRHPRAILLDVPLILIAGAPLHQEILDNPAAWRPVSLLPGGPKNSAARRMSAGLMRMNGDRHAHYRKMLAAPLRRTSVEQMGPRMVQLAEADITAWPAGESIELWQYARRALRSVTLGLLFGGEDDESRTTAEMVADLTAQKWASGSLAFPLNLPFTPYRRMLRASAMLEDRVLTWASTKRGRDDDRDLAALIVNRPDADGQPASDATIAGHIPSLYAGATEAGQSTLFWTLILLAQHPRVAGQLLRELRERLADDVISMQAVQEFPLLDAVVKESMRLIPPVPLQMRVAQEDTTLAGQRIAKHSRVVLGTFLTTRMPDLYPEPDRFLPERWSKIDPTPFEYPVFGAGPRICPGYWFGLNAIKVTLATMLTRYRIAIEPGTRIDYRIQPTIRPTGPVRATLHRQDGAFAATPIRGAIQKIVRL
jgi:cytochrome P450